MKQIDHLWQEYHSRFRSFIQKRIADENVVDDILQDVFLTLYSKSDQLKDETKFESWFYQITRNAIIDYYRSRKPTTELDESFPEPQTHEAQSVMHELTHCLEPMIQELPEEYRQAIELSELHGFSQIEVAEQQGISHSGAKSRVQRGRVLLRDMLSQCCEFKYDTTGKLAEYELKNSNCKNC